MNKFRKEITRNRIILIIITILLLFVALVTYQLLGATEKVANSSVQSFMDGARVGLVFGAEIALMSMIISITKGLRSEKELEKLYVKENDERKKMIDEKTFATGFRIQIIALTFAILIASYYSIEIFFALLAVLLFLAVIKIIVKVYYNMKF